MAQQGYFVDIDEIQNKCIIFLDSLIFSTTLSGAILMINMGTNIFLVIVSAVITLLLVLRMGKTTPHCREDREHHAAGLILLWVMILLLGVFLSNDNHPSFNVLLPGQYRTLQKNEHDIPPAHAEVKGYEGLVLVKKAGGKPAEWALLQVKLGQEWPPDCFEKLSGGEVRVLRCQDIPR